MSAHAWESPCARCGGHVPFGSGATLYRHAGGYSRRVVMGDTREERDLVHIACLADDCDAGLLRMVAPHTFEPTSRRPAAVHLETA